MDIGEVSSAGSNQDGRRDMAKRACRKPVLKSLGLLRHLTKFSF
jgi:hypothetical protein